MVRLVSLLILIHPQGSFAADKQRPNLVLLLADDLGYGEVQHLNPERGRIATPHLDALATSGMVFTNAHSSSAVCTPTRYGLMTGRYAWRTRLQQGVVNGGRSLIDADRLTLAKMLKRQGYHTAIIGKWHLGMLFDGEMDASPDVPVGARVTEGPQDRGGFDEFFGFHHSRQINTLIENDRVREKIEPVEMLPRLTQRAVEYIDGRKDKDQPFFLFVSWNAPHSPVVPAKPWQDQSGLGEHADFVMQADHSVGQVVEALRRNGMLEDTIIISTADNGTSEKSSKAPELIAKGHFPSGDFRGYKADIWDGGHRVHFVVSWPSITRPGTSSPALISLNDVIATMAEILGMKLPPDAAEDAFSFYSLLRQDGTSLRRDSIHHSGSGHFAVRKGKWKLLLCPRSGGWSGQRPSKRSWDQAIAEGLPLIQLYDLEADRGEKVNLATRMPAKVAELRELLEARVHAGRSNAGPRQDNDVAVDIIKDPRKSE